MTKRLDYLFKPRSIAVIGASRNEKSVGYAILHNLIAGGFTGSIYPVNPKAEEVHGLPCYPSVLDIPGEVDLAFNVVPAKFVVPVTEECGRKGVKAMVVISAGFKETGPEGAKREEELVKMARKYGIRFVGPNCMGILNTSPEVKMNATFAKSYALRGEMALLSHSGALGIAILDFALDIKVGFSMFVSIGNMADLSNIDFLEYWAQDENTKVILLYLETFADARKFAEVAAKASQRKPIVVMKTGRTMEGARAAISHTGALASSDLAVDCLFDRAGVIRVDMVEEMFDLGKTLCKQPLPKGKRVGVISNGGGMGIIATDAVVRMGLSVPPFAEETQKRMKAALTRPEASVINPVDTIAQASYSEYYEVVKAALEDPGIDAVLVIFIPTMLTDPWEPAKAIVAAGKGAKKPILVSFVGLGAHHEGVPFLEKNGFPVYPFPEAAIKCLRWMYDYYLWRSRPRFEVKEFLVDKDKAREIIEKARAEEREKLSDLEGIELASSYGIPVARVRIAKDEDEAVAYAEEFGYPVVLKVHSPEIIHKSDVGGVIVGISSDSEVREAFFTLKERAAKVAGAQFLGVVVQEMVSGGKETIIGVSSDPMVGHLMMFGLGGIYVEVMKDVSFKLHPISEFDAEEMIRRIKGYPLLEGVRGGMRADIEALKEALLRVSQLVSDFPEIAEVDLNPFLVLPEGKGARAVDVRISLKKKA
ncbi:MAG: acetate--CoA ligase family protein [Acidobacteria bacterium]|nr:acetate--CoA ligase family protein [Acidobacteriota bacterium]